MIWEGVLGLSESGYWGIKGLAGLGSRGWVPVVTGTTVVGWGAGDGFPFARERRWWVGEPGMGSRCHGNDGGGWLVSLRRTGEGGFQTRPYGSRDRRRREGFKPAPTGAVTDAGGRVQTPQTQCMPLPLHEYLFRIDEALAGTRWRRRYPPHPSLLPPGEKVQETRRLPRRVISTH